jgi:hypothetical protein
MTRTAFLVVMTLLGAACPEKPAPTPAKRVHLERISGTTFRLVPSEGQYPYCLAYTVNRVGLTRQLTMSRQNVSFECPAGQPIGRRPFRVPFEEGPVKVHVLFTSQPVNAGSVSQQIIDADDRQALKVMNMRLPGNAAIETLDFVPEEDVPAQVGSLVGRDAGEAVGQTATDDGVP